MNTVDQFSYEIPFFLSCEENTKSYFANMTDVLASAATANWLLYKGIFPPAQPTYLSYHALSAPTAHTCILLDRRFMSSLSLWL